MLLINAVNLLNIQPTIIAIIFSSPFYVEGFVDIARFAGFETDFVVAYCLVDFGHFALVEALIADAVLQVVLADNLHLNWR